MMLLHFIDILSKFSKFKYSKTDFMYCCHPS